MRTALTLMMLFGMALPASGAMIPSRIALPDAATAAVKKAVVPSTPRPAAATVKKVVEPSTTRPAAPLAVQLAGVPSGDTVTLTAIVDVRSRLGADPTLRVTLPPGAVLVAGKAEEKLTAGAGAKVERRFVVKGAKGQVRVSAVVAGAASGARAEAAWPKVAVRTAPKVVQKVTPVPLAKRPVKLRGLTLDRAVPLKRTPKPPVIAP